MAARNHPVEPEGAGTYHRATSSHFFKVILQETVEKRKLRLPESFVRKHRESLCNFKAVDLEVPSGDVWNVGLQISKDGIFWLENGWVEFSSFYNLKHGHFLTFRQEFFESPNKFKVVIFDKSTTEIQYPIRPPVKKLSPLSSSGSSKISNHESSPSNLEEEEEEEAFVRRECFTPTDPCFEVVMQQSSLLFPYTLWLPEKLVEKYIKDWEKRGEIKLIDISPNGKSRTWVVIYSTPHVYSDQSVNRSNRRRVGVSSADWKSFVEHHKLMVGDVCVLQLMRSSGNIGNPLSFKITIRRATHEDQASTTHLSTKAGLKGNEDAANAEILAEEHDDVGNQNQCRRQTTIGYRTQDSKRKLVQDPKLQNFSKKIKEEDIIDLVSDEEETTSDENEGVVADKQQQQQAGCSHSVFKYPYFQQTISKSCLSTKRLFVNFGFVKDNINTELEMQNVTLESVGGRSWPVIKTYRGVQNLTFMCQVREFLEKNKVKVGDLCTFELVDKKNMVFRVSISRS